MLTLSAMDGVILHHRATDKPHSQGTRSICKQTAKFSISEKQISIHGYVNYSLVAFYCNIVVVFLIKF